MPQLLTLSRAARLVGITRGALQSKIKAGELATFEGMVSAEDLLRAYPEARLEDNTAFERFAQIKDSAFSRRVREHVLPNPEVLVARLAETSRQLAQSRREIEMRLRIARRQITEYAAQLTIDVAERRIIRSITPDDHLRLVDRYTAQLKEAR